MIVAMNSKITLIIVGAILILIYRLTWPWTPFWVDMAVIAAAACMALSQWNSRSESPESVQRDPSRVDPERKSSRPAIDED